MPRNQAIAEASRRRFAAYPRVYTPPNTPGIHPLAYARHPAARRAARGIIASYPTDLRNRRNLARGGYSSSPAPVQARRRQGLQDNNH